MYLRLYIFNSFIDCSIMIFRQARQVDQSFFKILNELNYLNFNASLVILSTSTLFICTHERIILTVMLEAYIKTMISIFASNGF